MKAIQLVPHRARVADGVGDFARALHAAGLTAEVVAAEDVGVRAPALVSAIEGSGADAVLLHYANYAYEPAGCPEELVGAIEGTRVRVVTLFHEVFAEGPFWRRAFWTSARQRALAARVARRSVACATTNPVYADLVRSLVPGKDVSVLPMASTAGETAEPPPFDARPRRLAVFGGVGGRALAFGADRDVLAAACRLLGADEIVDIGPPLLSPPSAVGRVPVRSLGALPVADVARELLACRFGVVSIPARLLSKSSVHAAYCAHGVVPLSLRGGEPGADLRAGVHYWRPGVPAEALPSLASAAAAWYREHPLRVQVEHYARLLS